MKKLLIILFCAGVALSVMAGEQAMSPEQFRRALANAELLRGPATPGASATAPLLLNRLQGQQQTGDFKSRLAARGPREMRSFVIPGMSSLLGEEFGTWIIDTEQYGVVRNDDGSYTVSDTCSYARGRAVTLYYDANNDMLFFDDFINLSQSAPSALWSVFDMPIVLYDEDIVAIPHQIYSGTEHLPTVGTVFKARDYHVYAIPEEWLNGDFVNNVSGDVYGSLWDDGTMCFQDGFMFLTEVVFRSYKFDPGVSGDGNVRGDDGTIIISTDTTYYCSPVMRNHFLLPSNATHEFVKHKKQAAAPADTTSTGNDDPVVVPGGLGGFGGFSENGVTATPTNYATTSLHFSDNYSTCGYTGPGTRPPRDKPGKPIDPGGTSRPSSHGGTLPGVSTLSVDGLILGDKLRSVFHPDGNPRDTLVAPTYICWPNDTTVNVYNLYGLGQMVQMYIRPDGTMYMPMQYLGDLRTVVTAHELMILRVYDVYNYTSADATLVDLTPGNVGEYDELYNVISWGNTAFVSGEDVYNYYYDGNMLYYNQDYSYRSGDKLTITDIMSDINALRDGDTSLTITDITEKINRLLHDSGQ